MISEFDVASPRAERTNEDLVGAAIDCARHFLPTQGPISVFVHHNTLHPFEDLPFERAVIDGGRLYGCEPYLSEQRFRDELARGRICVGHLREILGEDLGDRAEQTLGCFGTRIDLQMAMLQVELHSASEPELRWLLAETDLLTCFHDQASPHVRQTLVEQTRYFVMGAVGRNATKLSRHTTEATSLALINPLVDEFGRNDIQSWSVAKWESFTLHLLWRTIRRGVHAAGARRPIAGLPRRHRDVILETVGEDSDTLIDEILIRFCGVFLDQGLSDWPLPRREDGFAAAFAEMILQPLAIQPAWMKKIRPELERIVIGPFDPLSSIVHSLTELGFGPHEYREIILQTLLALRGWAGMLWQMESSVPWLPRPAAPGSLTEYLAIRLILERHALAFIGQNWFGTSDLKQLTSTIKNRRHTHAASSVNQASYPIFQLAQACGWAPQQLLSLQSQQWATLVEEMSQFPALDRRRILHLGFERRYRNQALDALSIHGRQRRSALSRFPQPIPAFHATFCIDDREESMRRHLEEVDPECETSSAAGFFAIAMYYRGADHALYRPLCPNVITPKHYVCEQPLFSETDTGEKRALRRRRLGQLTHGVHSSSRTLIGGWLTGIFGALATVPLVARILAPHLAAKIRKSFGTLVRPPATELPIERVASEPGAAPDEQGYSLDEMAGIVRRILQDIGLVKNMPRVILIVGHGSSSLNNPHESAYSCGACSGGRGGPNARAFALMANDSRVRALVAERGLNIPPDVSFLGAYHDTCADRVEYYDLDLLPRSHRPLFQRIQKSMDEARARNAHERIRRFDVNELGMRPSEALKHVEQRAEDLSQARPEYNHATNALVVVGRRAQTRGLFMDRRVFLTSYDYRIDDEDVSILTRILQAAIPVCAGISLEYYFSTVDSEGYGCGSKLPHNVASMLGVMTGAASDLRPGLSQQMVEIHEPMRILIVVETFPEKIEAIIRANPAVASLVEGSWVQLALIDPDTAKIQLYRAGAFEPYVPGASELPVAESSSDWYRGHSENLGFASVVDRAVAKGVVATPWDSVKGSQA